MARTEKTIEVDAPVAACFKRWAQFQRYPDFFECVTHVRHDGRTTVLHWRIPGKAGLDTVIGPMTPNELISWRSAEASAIQMAGVVRFRPGKHGGTQITLGIEMSEVRLSRGEYTGKQCTDPEQIVTHALAAFQTILRQEAVAAGAQANNAEDVGRQIPENYRNRPGGDQWVSISETTQHKEWGYIGVSKDSADDERLDI